MRIKKIKSVKVIYYFILIFFLFCGENKMFQIDDKLPTKLIEASSDEWFLISSADLIKKIPISFNGITYNYGINEGNIVIYIETNDAKFRTEEGFSLHTTYNEIITNKTNLIIKKELGWAFFIPLESGWNAAFVIGETATEKEPSHDEKVKFFFKRK